ncbi:hypothetical protein [Enterococcus sp. C76]|uniref:hypothetical protein n=1 Tax=Enterococcus sp. C76 TaxID=3231334 RepID=UPI0034A06701
MSSKIDESIKEIERLIIDMMDRNHVTKIPMNVCLKQYDAKGRMIFLSRMKYFRRLRRWYKQQPSGVCTYFVRV